MCVPKHNSFPIVPCLHEVVALRMADVYTPCTMIPKTDHTNSAASTTTESPCIKVCVLDADQQCRGCGRTVDEITRWRDMTSDERIAIKQRVGFVSHERVAKYDVRKEQR